VLPPGGRRVDGGPDGEVGVPAADESTRTVSGGTACCSES